MRKLAVPVIVTVAGACFLWAAAAQQTEKAGRSPIIFDRAPVRTIQDPYPVFNGITMDIEKGELIAADDNSSSLITYHSEFAPTDKLTEPVRKIGGPKTHLGFVCGVAISPEHQEIYSVSGEGQRANVFPIDANGDVAPLRQFPIDHGAGDIFLDLKNDELFITTEHINKVSVHRRTAGRDEKEIRYIQGPKTGLADPQRIFVDHEGNEVYVTNHGSWRKTESGEPYVSVVIGNKKGAAPLRPSTGQFFLPSVTVYPRTAQGDVAPLRTIQGAHTRLNVPLGVSLDRVSGQIAVANSGDSSILFFDKNASGDATPVRVIKGPATGINGPSGTFIDTKRNEIWVGNWDNHTATVYSRTADGNVAPLRTMRSAPKGQNFAGFGNIGDVVFDPKRKELLVTN